MKCCCKFAGLSLSISHGFSKGNRRAEYYECLVKIPNELAHLLGGVFGLIFRPLSMPLQYLLMRLIFPFIGVCHFHFARYVYLSSPWLFIILLCILFAVGQLVVLIKSAHTHTHTAIENFLLIFFFVLWCLYSFRVYF